MNFNEDIEMIIDYAHCFNWCPDLIEVQKIYNFFPDSYSVLTPFMYSYLEECIRSTTSEYGIEVFDEKNNPKRRKVGIKLINLAIKENSENISYISILNGLKKYFTDSTILDVGDNRNSVDHGYMHPINWTKDSFENLVHDIAKISPFVRF